MKFKETYLVRQINKIKKTISTQNPDGIIVFEMSRKYRELEEQLKQIKNR